METAKGRIAKFDEEGITIHIPLREICLDRAILQQYKEVVVGFADGRTISPEQRRKAYALLNEIAEWMGEVPEYVKRLMKLDFIAKMQNDLAKSIFSLANCDMTTAKEFISYLIDFILMHDVPVSVPLIELCEDIARYVYACLMNKRCAVCGKKGELHHFDAIGMGRGREEVYQIGMKVLPLCRLHHDEAHSKGRDYVLNVWHLVPVALTREIGKKYGLTKKNLQKEAVG